MEKMSEKKRFSWIARIKSANHAMRGLTVLIKTSHNFLGHLVGAGLVIYLGWTLNISITEWILLTIVMGMILIAEAFNTAMEIDIDLTSPNYHPYARDTKDVAAASVTIAVVIACIVGMFIFAPKIFALFL